MAQFRLILIVDAEELALDVYFKREETGQQFIRWTHILVGQVVWVLKRTRDYELVIRRTL